MEAQEFIIARTGEKSLRFEGYCTHQVVGDLYGKNDQNRYHEISVFAATSGKTVLQIMYHTKWKGEEPWSDVWVFEEQRPELEAVIMAYDPLAHVVGYPAGKQFEEKQARLEADIITRWQALISQFMDETENYDEL